MCVRIRSGRSFTSFVGGCWNKCKFSGLAGASRNARFKWFEHKNIVNGIWYESKFKKKNAEFKRYPIGRLRYPSSVHLRLRNLLPGKKFNVFAAVFQGYILGYTHKLFQLLILLRTQYPINANLDIRLSLWRNFQWHFGI